jgi:hypothetical protein
MPVTSIIPVTLLCNQKCCLIPFLACATSHLQAAVGQAQQLLPHSRSRQCSRNRWRRWT